MKLILGIVEVQNQPVQLTHLEDMNFDFHEFLHFLKAEIYLNNKIQSPKNVQKRQFSELSPKIDFTKKSEWLKNPKLSTMYCGATAQISWNQFL